MAAAVRYQFLLYFVFIRSVFSSLKVVTSNVGLAGNSLGSLAAFGDFNADKKADLFFINNAKDKSKVDVYLWDSKEFEMSQATITLEKVIITNVIPGDFNSDGHLDALLSYYNKTLPLYQHQTFVKLFLGIDSHFELNNIIELGDALTDQPAIVDFNGDLQPDLLADKESDGKRYWWSYSRENNSFTSELVVNTTDMLPLSIPHSCAFLDMNGDYTADMVLTTENTSSKVVKYEVWLNTDGVFTTNKQEIYSKPDSAIVVGQSTFADIDSNGFADHILPVCFDKACTKSGIYVRTTNTWSPILRSEDSQNYKWNFFKGTVEDSIPLMTIRIGDYNMDGYPDAAMVVEITHDNDKGSPKRRVVLLENVKCGSGASCYNGRTFSMDLDATLYSIDSPVIVGFFDLYDDGTLDLMVVSSNDTANTYQTHAIQNVIYSDTCFLKVMVLGGSCYSDCPSGVTPYGVNQAGPCVKYVTTGLHGNTKVASATQLSQAAYFALQPPYIVFGLGRTPNFVEELIVGLPRSRTSPIRVHTWTSIIPNSQVIIIPYPPDDPSAWTSMLLVTPSRLFLLTGGALLATCVFIAALVGVLHWREKREDRREKQEAAHKFHFDAM
ncbi:Hypothetical predicted protein [Paramuricea clavata]|uniref:T-cell immunomodulatory protein TIP C2 domain-containing protein n=1 Tax=Paramuricea clavata TaxID=317549 RepID=A0A6S7ICV8_PARCT|nr:Hypothetical predicted protein [Paramuricea clavata]